MAKTATLERNPDEKKKKKKSAAAAPAVKVKSKAKTKTKTKKDKVAKKAEPKSSKREGLEGLARLVDHPLVADLLAAGAIAAVAAIAEHRMGQGESSSKMVKSVGKAAAAAMGKRLMGDIGAVATAATDAAKKA